MNQFTFMGFGLLTGQRRVYYGGQARISRTDDQTEMEQKTALAAFTEQALIGAIKLHEREDCSPDPTAPVELFGCFDAESGDVILMWRQPMVGDSDAPKSDEKSEA